MKDYKYVANREWKDRFTGINPSKEQKLEETTLGLDIIPNRIEKLKKQIKSLEKLDKSFIKIKKIKNITDFIFSGNKIEITFKINDEFSYLVANDIMRELVIFEYDNNPIVTEDKKRVKLVFNNVKGYEI